MHGHVLARRYMRRKCLLPLRPPPQVLPASSSAPKYKFVVPNEYVYKFMQVGSSHSCSSPLPAASLVLGAGGRRLSGAWPCVVCSQWRGSVRGCNSGGTQARSPACHHLHFLGI